MTRKSTCFSFSTVACEASFSFRIALAMREECLMIAS